MAAPVVPAEVPTADVPAMRPCACPRLLASLARYATLPYQRIGFPLSPSTWVLGDARDPMRARRRTHQPPRPRLTPSVEITQSCRRYVRTCTWERRQPNRRSQSMCAAASNSNAPPRARAPNDQVVIDRVAGRARGVRPSRRREERA